MKSFIKALMSGGKQKTYGTGAINKVEPNVPETKGEKIKRDLALATQKRKTSEVKLDNTIFRINQQKKRLEDMQTKKRNEGSKKLFEASKGRKFNKGGRVGLKKGSFPDFSGDGKTTMKDILMARGVIPKPKNKKMAKKSKSPIDKTVRKS